VSRLDRFVGLVRSVAIYHAIPLRQRRLRRLYSQFVSPGDLVFDVGAHAGNRTRAFASLNCRVVALEPQPDFIRLLRTVLANASGVEIVAAAVTDHEGYVTLAVSERTPTVTTVVESWREVRSREEGFDGVHWNRQIEVKATTLDRLIEQFGLPAFVKIDVEGAEPRVLAGLSHPVPALSFEYLPTALDQVRDCLATLCELAPYDYNFSIGESYRLASERWLSSTEVNAALESPAAQRRAGDVYARLPASTS
jgi:FkbM family methyltransferase